MNLKIHLWIWFWKFTWLLIWRCVSDVIANSFETSCSGWTGHLPYYSQLYLLGWQYNLFIFNSYMVHPFSGGPQRSKQFVHYIQMCWKSLSVVRSSVYYSSQLIKMQYGNLHDSEVWLTFFFAKFWRHFCHSIFARNMPKYELRRWNWTCHSAVIKIIL